MTVKLKIEIEGPVGPDDADILGGTAMILLALVQKTGVNEEEEKPTPEEVEAFTDVLAALANANGPAACGAPGTDGQVCHGVVGHRGRHLFRQPAVPGMN